MTRSIARSLAAASIVAAALVAPLWPAPHAAASGSIEGELLALINDGRAGVGKGRLVSHAGLQAPARAHAQDMAAAGAMSHEGAEGRVFGAAPDPAEGGPAPDDGFTGRWCENVGFVEWDVAADVPRLLYQAWSDSPSHRACMLDSVGRGLTVAGLAVVSDGNGTWWATLELAADRTLPGAATARPAEPRIAPAAPAPAATAIRPAAAAAPAVRAPAAPRPLAVADPDALTGGVLAPRVVSVEPLADVTRARTVTSGDARTSAASEFGGTAGLVAAFVLAGIVKLRSHRRRALWPAGCEKPPSVYVPGRMIRPRHAWSAWTPARTAA